MASIFLVLINILVLQAISTAAPSEKLANTYNIQTSLELDTDSVAVTPYSIEGYQDNKRQKRFYDNINIVLPSLAHTSNRPISGEQHYSKRDEGQYTGVSGIEDEVNNIIKSVQGSISGFRQYSQPWAPSTNIPLLIPFLYLPQNHCRCNTNTEVPVKPVNNKPEPDKTSTLPDFPTRVNVVDDPRPNTNTNIEDDVIRPIDFNPIVTEPVRVPVPPVEHGSVQEDSQAKRTPTTTLRSSERIPITHRGRTPSISPTICDKAVISCCFRSQITHQCFEQEGCPDISSYGIKPCNPEVITNLLKKTQHFYQQINKNA